MSNLVRRLVQTHIAVMRRLQSKLPNNLLRRKEQQPDWSRRSVLVLRGGALFGRIRGRFASSYSDPLELGDRVFS